MYKDSSNHRPDAVNAENTEAIIERIIKSRIHSLQREELILSIESIDLYTVIRKKTIL
jgi:hypothetical protein